MDFGTRRVFCGVGSLIAANLFTGTGEKARSFPSLYVRQTVANEAANF